MTFVVKDCVHCNLALPQYVEEIVSTKEFQRLKNLKQLGKLVIFAVICFDVVLFLKVSHTLFFLRLFKPEPNTASVLRIFAVIYLMSWNRTPNNKSTSYTKNV